MEKFKPNLLKCICFFCFVLIFCSCGPSHTGGKAVATATSTNHSTSNTSSTPTPLLTVSSPPDCPPANTARAAVMPGITLGTHPTIFYETVINNQLEFYRYDVTTGQTTQVISLPNQEWERGGFLSNDGQWIIFYDDVGTQEAIQMVRVDGQDLQTLYCGEVSGLLLSPDQKTLAFDTGNLEMLDMASGKLQTDYTGSKDASGNWISYAPVKWQTNTSLFVAKIASDRGVGHPLPNPEVDLMKDARLDSNSQATNFQQVFAGGGLSLDINQNQFLISDYTVTNAETGPSKITLQTLDGNVSTIYTDPNNAIQYAYFVSRTKIAFLVDNVTVNPNHNEISTIDKNVGIWTINTDGTALAQIAAFPDNSGLGALMVSRDGSQYLVDVGSHTSQSWVGDNLFFGSLQGTSATPVTGTFALGKLAPIGWSTF